MTRSNDQYLSLNQRVNISHAQKADAFISIHYNAFSSTSSGIITFYYNNSKDGRLAQSIHNGLLAQTGMKNLGAKYGNYHVLRTNKRPSVLLELGFLSNPKEETCSKKFPNISERPQREFMMVLINTFLNNKLKVS